MVALEIVRIAPVEGRQVSGDVLAKGAVTRPDE
jgi:hypothetical protein